MTASVRLAAAVEENLVTMVELDAEDCCGVFGLLSPTEGVAATELGTLGCCEAAESVAIVACDGLSTILELIVVKIADGLLLLLGSVAATDEPASSPVVALLRLPLPAAPTRAFTPFASEQKTDPILAVLDPKLAGLESVKVEPKVIVPRVSLKAWHVISS